MDAPTLPRLVARSLAERLRVMPAVVVTGARQTGKSTLAQELAPGSRRYFSLDDLDTVDVAQNIFRQYIFIFRKKSRNEVECHPLIFFQDSLIVGHNFICCFF